MNKYIKSKFTNYDPKSLLELLKIICEDISPYYSNTCKMKTPSTCRMPDAKIKCDALSMNENIFHKIGETIYYFGKTNVYQIDPERKTCSCRWNLSYATCKHIYKYQFLFSVFFFLIIL